MINVKHLSKVFSAWISIVYTVCFAGAALFPGIREGFMLYGLHMNVDMGQNVATLGTFLSGLIIWNVITLSALWLFAALYDSIEK